MSSGDNHKTFNGKVHTNDVEKNAQSKPILRLHKSPLKTVYYACMESFHLLMQFIGYLLSHKRIIVALGLVSLAMISMHFIDGKPREVLITSILKVQWWSWWVLLGFLSSCGFGSGLHTFVLYLGPFIAKVTMAAYECRSLEFPAPPYPEEFICPLSEASYRINTWIIIHKVIVESVLWGVGTAIGELPPYFMARAASLSAERSNNNLMQEAEETPWQRKCRHFISSLINRVGFVGIMLCASIPNPLFDLAGMTCGHFLVPFSTFFGATLVGKAINKMMIQMLFVILIFSEDKVQWFQQLVKRIPSYGASLNGLIDEFLTKQKEKIHKSLVNDSPSWLAVIFSYIQMLVIAGFLISIIHSLADSYYQRNIKALNVITETSRAPTTPPSNHNSKKSC